MDTMTSKIPPEEQLRAENAELRARLDEAEDTLRSIRSGEVEALVVETADGLQIFTLQGLDAESNRFRGEILAQVSDSVIAVDADQRVTYVNAAAERQYRVSASDALGRPLSDIFIRQWPDADTESAMWAALREHGEWRGEVTHRTHDGREIAVETSITALRDMSGSPAGYVAAIRDITERKQVEATLEQATQRLEFALKIAPVTLFSQDLDLRYTWIFNPALGLNYKQVIGKLDSDIMERAEDAANTVAMKRKVLRTGASERSDVTVLADGMDRCFDLIVEALMDNGGSIIGVTCAAIDITGRRQAEADLRASEEFNRTVLESSPDCVKVLDGEGRLQYLNANGLCQLEIDDFAPLQNEFWWNLWGTENVETVKQAVNRSLQGETAHFQAFCPTPKGTPKWWDVVVSPIPGTTGSAKRLISVSRDITEQKRGERQLLFLSEISQDLLILNPLNEIMQTLGAKIGSFLNLSLCGFMEIDEAADNATMTNDWHRPDVPTLAGKYRISEFVTGEFHRASRAGEVFIVSDTDTDPRTDAENYAAINVGSFVSVPIISAGEWRFLVVMFDTKARNWRADEIDLMRELTTRIWTSMERRRAETALRAAHGTFRHLVENSPFGIYVVDADFRVAQVSAGAQKIFENVRPVIGRDFAEVMHIIWPEEFASEFIKFFRHTLETGESYRVPSTTEQRRDIGVTESYDWKLERITLPDGRFGVVCHFYDLSERQRYEAQLQAARDELEIRVGQRTEELATTNSALVAEVSQRKVAEEQKIDLLQKVAKTQEDERSRIARDLHDQMGQRLTGFRLKLQSLIGLAGDDEEIRSGLLALSEIGQTLDDDVGFLAWELRPPMLNEIGLEKTLAEYVSEWSKRSGIETVFHSSGFGSTQLEPEIAINLYRIAQEALNNTAKYAKPKSVNVLLRRSTDSVALIIEDDGSGFDLTQKKASTPGRGFGLRGMRERANIIGGKFEIESATGRGTTIIVKVPIAFNIATDDLRAHA